jgi:hypothetical protein
MIKFYSDCKLYVATSIVWFLDLSIILLCQMEYVVSENGSVFVLRRTCGIVPTQLSPAVCRIH